MPVIKRRPKTSQNENSAAIGVRAVTIALPASVYPTIARAPSHSANMPPGNDVTK